MTVCGIKHADGVCVMGKCPYVKKCCPAVWDKSGKVEMTNEEWLRSLNTEELAEFLADRCNETVDWILHEMDEHAGNIDQDDYWYRQDAFVEWLKQPHREEKHE